MTTGGQRGAARHPLSSQGAVLPGGSTGASAHAEQVAVGAAGRESRGKGTWFGAGVAVSDPGWEGCAPSGGQSRHCPPEHRGRPSPSQGTGPNHTPAGGRPQPEMVRAQPALGTSSGWLSQALGVCVGGGEGPGSVPPRLDPVPDGPLLPRAPLHHQPQPEVGVLGQLHLQAPASVTAHDGAALQGRETESARAPGGCPESIRGVRQGSLCGHSQPPETQGPVCPLVPLSSYIPPTRLPCSRGLRSPQDTRVQDP